MKTAVNWVITEGWELRNDRWWNKHDGELVGTFELMERYADYCIEKQFVSTSE